MIFGYKSGLPSRGILYLPLIGMAMFIILYIVSAILYPGGSWKFQEAEGFSFWHNYLCDLLDEYAINGQLNTARYVSRAALGFLCGGLLLLWYHFPNFFEKNSTNQKVMWSSGILALVTTCFLSSGTHDFTVRLAGLFGSIAFISCFIELFRNRSYRLFYFGIFCLIIFVVNYYVYETGIFIRALPIIQKITFLSFISWFVWVNLLLIKKTHQPSDIHIR